MLLLFEELLLETVLLLLVVVTLLLLLPPPDKVIVVVEGPEVLAKLLTAVEDETVAALFAAVAIAALLDALAFSALISFISCDWSKLAITPARLILPDLSASAQ